MAPKKQHPFIDPVILIALGVVLVTVAIVLTVLPSGSNNAGAFSSSGTLSQLMVAFVTGLTTGGLSCLAVQGGLLASSLAHQIEQEYIQQATQNKPRKKSKIQTPARSSPATSIFLCLVAKIAAYSLLGALLGWLGSYLT